MAGRVGVDFTYLSKIECGKLDFGDYPGEGLIVKLAKALGAEENVAVDPATGKRSSQVQIVWGNNSVREVNFD